MISRQYGVILDTHIIIKFIDLEYDPIISILRDENWFLLICDKLEEEYYKQVNNKYSTGWSFLQHFFDRLRTMDKLVRERQPDTTTHYRIQNRKDQAHIDCAIHSNAKAWVIVTNDTYDYQWVNQNAPLVPIIVDWDSFQDKNYRSNLLAECRRIAIFPPN